MFDQPSGTDVRRAGATPSERPTLLRVRRLASATDSRADGGGAAASWRLPAADAEDDRSAGVDVLLAVESEPGRPFQVQSVVDATSHALVAGEAKRQGSPRLAAHRSDAAVNVMYFGPISHAIERAPDMLGTGPALVLISGENGAPELLEGTLVGKIVGLPVLEPGASLL